MASSSAQFEVIRLKPKTDLKKALLKFAHERNLQAGFIASGIGSLETINIRFANQDNGFRAAGYHEILTLSGTLSIRHAHVHITLADSTGKTIGGHLLDENIIYTTAEIVIGILSDVNFERRRDDTYGYDELFVSALKK